MPRNNNKQIMTIFENRIYRVIIEYLWFDSKNKSYARSLCLVNWYFHRVICSLNVSFKGSFKDLNELFTHHFQKQSSSDSSSSQQLNKCALFSSLTELRIGRHYYREPIPYDDLKMILPNIRSFSSLRPREYKLMVENGMHSLDYLEVNTDTEIDLYAEKFQLLSSNLKHLKMVVHRVDSLCHQFETYFPFTRYLVSEAFQKLTSLDIVDTNTLGSYCYFMADSRDSSILFDGLLNFQSLQHLGFTFAYDIVVKTEFHDVLLEYLKKQKTLRSFHFPHRFHQENNRCLRHLLKKSSIEQISVNICELIYWEFPNINRNNLKKLRVISDLNNRLDYGNLASVKHVKIIQTNSEWSKLYEIRSLLESQQEEQALKGFHANRVLKLK
ncbi:hypothetical protein PPL_00883 [Heterostelium album PN500]|uniref:F-box domain-containing protein n=1 Tax=Heterostelium pallidum (strain ATCC 26659 / Pp 5 / PN500) TaxID=670386 RepID=D3AYW4_HETP5|nr:hypothetical protein PPL_00883 [Heterostelium album PN500]EFA85654.1 hypothetical protein PPL_00883 [Heterostelium album PN500]|eukprot:XP_020437761.1 hypothetical protein PPL_00883 [Heterostelium album PN500]